MSIHITMDDAATYLAGKLLSRQQISEERKTQILPATKYNVLVKTFNTSSVLLLAATVTALFLAMTTSFVFLFWGLFSRYTSERELEKYTAPYQRPVVHEDQPTPTENRSFLARITDLLRHSVKLTTEEDKINNVFLNVGLSKANGWQRYEVIFLDFGFWMNPIEIPEVVERVR